ncbi:fibrinogen-like YCDxxxxGGGW domain-containing protein [Pseudomarimonas arenosa]|uniref:Fibrinogen C-terminal domain-containing protein n=1 Tax=Pseudomarimonas arenosa TaxID=2774145 RepID=A0AAW3ZQY5_9GAMM|nr:fibrinogen-like YCDxxxxGGGW domain-containing protein [Pseudomarimonas arenosa]MBD8526691.1 hypothetical protein [Pseudomarimonas arenosa]
MSRWWIAFGLFSLALCQPAWAESCKSILGNNPAAPSGVYSIDPDDEGPLGSVDVVCDMVRDGGGWTFGLKTWYQSGLHSLTGSAGTTADALTLKGNPYKLSDDVIRAIIGLSENFDVLADQAGYNSAYSTGNHEYVVLRNFTGTWTFGAQMPVSSTATTMNSYRASDNTLAWTGALSCGGRGGPGINCYDVVSNNPMGGSGCAINMGTSSNSGWHHFYMAETNSDSYLYICNGAQHSSGYNMNHRFWFRETAKSNQSALSVSSDPSAIMFGSTSTLSTSGGSGTGAVSFAITAGSEFCEVSSTTVTGIGVGSCTVTATKAGDGMFNPASATVDITVSRAEQADLAAVASPLNIVFGATSTLSTTGGSGSGAVGFAVTAGSDFCDVSDTTLTGIGVGTCTVTATKAGDDYYNVATAEVNVTVDRANQAALTAMASPSTIGFGGSSTLGSSGGSGTGAVSFAISSGGTFCSISENILSGIGVGTCTVTATKAADSNFAAATASVDVVVDKASQATLTASATPASIKIGEDSELSTSGGSGSGAVTFAVTAGSTFCSISDTTLSGTDVGTCTVTASKAADDNYLAATATVDVTVENAAPTLSLTPTLFLLEDLGSGLVFTVGDDQTPAADLVVSLASDNQTLLADANLATNLTVDDANRILDLQLEPDANGVAVITVRVTDGASAFTEGQSTVTVGAVNDAPSAAFAGNEVWPAGESGAKAVTDFASLFNPGPGNESDQTVSIELATESDPSGVLSGISIDGSGTLSYTLTGNSGAARIRLQAVDDGGTANGGVDRGQAVTRRIIVGDGVDVTVSIWRGAPVGKLGEAMVKGSTLAEYSVEVRNNSAQDANGLRLRVSPIIGLTNVLWNCVISSCTPPNGSGEIDTQVDLQAGGVLLLGLSGSVDINVPFVEISAQATLPQGAVVLLSDDDRRVLIESTGGNGVYKSGFE